MTAEERMVILAFRSAPCSSGTTSTSTARSPRSSPRSSSPIERVEARRIVAAAERHCHPTPEPVFPCIVNVGLGRRSASSFAS